VLLEGGLGVVVAVVGVSAFGRRALLPMLAAFAFFAGLLVGCAWEYTRPVTPDTDTSGLRPAIVLFVGVVNLITALFAGWAIRAVIGRARPIE
jgi:hypothetical protein